MTTHKYRKALECFKKVLEDKAVMKCCTKGIFSQ